MVASVHAKGQQSYSSQSMGDAPELETRGRVSVAVARRRWVRASWLRAVWVGLVQIMIFPPRARKAARTAIAARPRVGSAVAVSRAELGLISGGHRNASSSA
jgi:hypothetical protein